MKLIGTLAGDFIVGTLLNDSLSGSDGDDTIYGLAGSDYLHGGQGNDVLYGGNGADLIHGARGDDTLWGGNGSDVFDFGNSDNPGHDQIMDFVLGVDTLSLRLGEGGSYTIAYDEITNVSVVDFVTGTVTVLGAHVTDADIMLGPAV